MIGRARGWWRLRSRREQRLLLVMAALATLVLAWLLVARPVDDALADARRAHAEAVIAAARVEREAAVVRGIERTIPRRTSLPVAARIAALADDAGIVPARSAQAGEGVALTIDAVRPAALFAWIERIERQEGLVIDRFAARTNADRTLAVEMTIRGRR